MCRVPSQCVVSCVSTPAAVGLTAVNCFSDLSCPTVPLSVAAAQHAVAERHTRLSDAAVPDKYKKFSPP